MDDGCWESRQTVVSFHMAGSDGPRVVPRDYLHKRKRVSTILVFIVSTKGTTRNIPSFGVDTGRRSVVEDAETACFLFSCREEVPRTYCWTDLRGSWYTGR